MARGLWLLLVSFGLSSCYSLKQAYWFNNAFNGRQAVQEALQRSDITNEDRQKLQLSREVLGFAKQQGLNTGDSYQHFIPAGPGTQSHLVQAAYPDRLEMLTWWFPVVGRVPYLGFFDKADRDAKALELQKEHDISLGTVGAFSSLGWFSDPIFASMLRRSDEDFIQMLLHELVHRSFWSQGSAVFNENLAEFVSLKLTEIYLRDLRGGRGLQAFLQYRQDREKLRQWIVALKEALRQVYARQDLDREAKLKEKASIIELYRQQHFPKVESIDVQSAKHRDWNNASLLGAALYAPDTERFEKALACLPVPDMRHFLQALQQAERSHDKAEESLDSLCKQS